MPKKKPNKHAATSNSHEVPSDMGVFAEKEGSGTSDVPKTSQSICKTLGSNNTQSCAIGETAIDKLRGIFRRNPLHLCLKITGTPARGFPYTKLKTRMMWQGSKRMRLMM